jgi:hypothetical protein
VLLFMVISGSFTVALDDLILTAGSLVDGAFYECPISPSS